MHELRGGQVASPNFFVAREKMHAPGLLLALACCCTLLWLVWRVLHHY